jgi:hypothetical protein
MNNSRKKTKKVTLGLWLILITAAVLIVLGALQSGFGGIVKVFDKLNGSDTPTTAGAEETHAASAAEVAGVEIYDLSMYEESSQEYAQALAQLEEDWFPRTVIVMPKGPEGGEFPNAPLPIYDAFPGQKGETADGETYTITRTWIGDIAVGTEVLLDGVVLQGEWCFVTGDTIGGWSSSGWVWCYRLFIAE